MGRIDNTDLVREFARRTRRNLNVIRGHVLLHGENSAFEVTQNINSLLGLLVLPHEHLRDRLQKDATPLEDLAGQGWPVIEPDLWLAPKPHTLGGFVTKLRHGIAHFNIRFVDDGQKLTGIRVWNVPPTGEHAGKKDFEVALSTQQLASLADRMLQWLMEQDEVMPKGEPPAAQPRPPKSAAGPGEPEQSRPDRKAK